jgi:hypothetical protein
MLEALTLGESGVVEREKIRPKQREIFDYVKPGAVIAWLRGGEWMAAEIIGLSEKSDKAFYVCTGQEKQDCDFWSCGPSCEHYAHVALDDNVAFKRKLEGLVKRAGLPIVSSEGVRRYKKAVELLRMIEALEAKKQKKSQK